MERQYAKKQYIFAYSTAIQFHLAAKAPRTNKPMVQHSKVRVEMLDADGSSYVPPNHHR
jgi:hypothetical protein